MTQNWEIQPNINHPPCITTINSCRDTVQVRGADNGLGEYFDRHKACWITAVICTDLYWRWFDLRDHNHYDNYALCNVIDSDDCLIRNLHETWVKAGYSDYGDWFCPRFDLWLNQFRERVTLDAIVQRIQKKVEAFDPTVSKHILVEDWTFGKWTYTITTPT